MERMSSLARLPICTTNLIEEAEVVIGRSLTDVRVMRVADRNRFRLEMNGVNVGHTSLVFNRFETDTKLIAGMTEDNTLFTIGGSVPSKFSFQNQSVIASLQRAAILTSSEKVQIERFRGGEILVLRTDHAELLQHFEKLTDQHHPGPLVFDRCVDLTNGPGATLKRIMNCLVAELTDGDQIENSALLKSFDELLLTALLSLPHNLREKLYQNRRSLVAPGVVRRAEEYMRAHLHEAIAITDLLPICGCSRSALFSTFQKSRGYTPMEFLAEQRLQKALGATP